MTPTFIFGVVFHVSRFSQMIPAVTLQHWLIIFSIFRSHLPTKMVRYSRLAVGAAAALAFCSALPGKLTVERVMSTACLALLIHLIAAKSIGGSSDWIFKFLCNLFRHLLL